MGLIAGKRKLLCALLTVILSGSLCTRVVLADDESKTVPASERALLCQRLDENARRLASTLDAPFYVVYLQGLAALFCGNRIALSRSARYRQSQRKVAA